MYMQIYSGIEGIEIPNFDFKDVVGFIEREKITFNKLKTN